MDPALHKWGVTVGASSRPCRNGGGLEDYFHAGDFDGALVYSKGECGGEQVGILFFYLDITGFSFLFGNIHVCGTLD